MDCEFTIAATHASLSGHFPGNPVVPGTVILDEVIRCMKQSQPDTVVEGFPSVKFVSTLKPDELVLLSIKKKNESTYSFTCKHQDQLLVNGQLRVKSVNKIG